MTSNPPKREKEIFPKYFNTTSYIHTKCLVSVIYTLILGQFQIHRFTPRCGTDDLLHKIYIMQQIRQLVNI